MKEEDKFEEDISRLVRQTNALTGKLTRLIEIIRKNEVSMMHKDQMIDDLKCKLFRFTNHNNPPESSSRQVNVVDIILSCMEDPSFDDINQGIVFNRGIRDFCEKDENISTDEFKECLKSLGYASVRRPVKYKGKTERYWSKGGLNIKDINNGL